MFKAEADVVLLRLSAPSLSLSLSSCFSANQGETGRARRRPPRLPQAGRPAGRIDEGHTGHCMECLPGRCSGKANPAPQEWSKFDLTSRLGQSLVRNPATNASLDSPWDGRKHERPREERKSKAVGGGSKKGRSFSYPIGGRGREEGHGRGRR